MTKDELIQLLLCHIVIAADLIENTNTKMQKHKDAKIQKIQITIFFQGEMTRDELAQLLLCYIGTAADIIEFFDSFKVTSQRSK